MPPTRRFSTMDMTPKSVLDRSGLIQAGTEKSCAAPKRNSRASGLVTRPVLPSKFQARLDLWETTLTPPVRTARRASNSPPAFVFAGQRATRRDFRFGGFDFDDFEQEEEATATRASKIANLQIAVLMSKGYPLSALGQGLWR